MSNPTRTEFDALVCGTCNHNETAPFAPGDRCPMCGGKLEELPPFDEEDSRLSGQAAPPAAASASPEDSPFGPQGARRFGARAPEPSPALSPDVSRLVEELDAQPKFMPNGDHVCAHCLDDIPDATGSTRLCWTCAHEAADKLVAALRQAASQLIGMTGERDAERLISQEWEEKCYALKKRLDEAEALIDEAVRADLESEQARFIENVSAYEYRWGILPIKTAPPAETKPDEKDPTT